MHGEKLLILDIATDNARRRLWLRPGQVVDFGRTYRCDECFPHDVGMSSRHFRLQHTPAGWSCRDLQSTNGTFINDIKIAEAVVHPGDCIRAGNTLFVVVPPQTPGASQVHSIEQLPAPSVQRALVLRQPLPGELTYRAHATSSGLHLFAGQKSKIDPAFVLQLLSKNSSSLIVCDRPDPAEDLLEDRIISLSDDGDVSGSMRSRVIIAKPTYQFATKLFNTRWGHDDLIAVAGVRTIDDSIAALQMLAHCFQDEIAQGPLPELRPAALAEFSLNRVTKLNDVLAEIEFLFVEIFQGDRWAVIARPDREHSLQALGFQPAAT